MRPRTMFAVAIAAIVALAALWFARADVERRAVIGAPFSVVVGALTEVRVTLQPQ